MRCFFLLLFIFLHSSVTAQYKSIYHCLEKKKYESAILKIDKYAASNGHDAGTWCLRGLAFCDSVTPQYDLELAYTAFANAQKDFTKLTDKKRKALFKIKIDSNFILNKVIETDYSLYKKNTIQNNLLLVNNFIKDYPNNTYYSNALYLRDSLALLDIYNKKRAIHFKEYLDSYPLSRFTKQVRLEYENLLYEEKLKEGSLDGLVKYLNENPNTSKKSLIEKRIYGLATPFLKSAYYEKFIQHYPDNEYVTEARSCLYWLREAEFSPYNEQAEVWWPYIKDGKIGFMDGQGKRMLEPVFEDVPQSYFCEGATDKTLIIKSAEKYGLFSRTKKSLIPTIYDSIIFLNPGFVGLQNSQKRWAIALKNGILTSGFDYDSLHSFSRYAVIGRKNILNDKSLGVFSMQGVSLCWCDSVIRVGTELMLCMKEKLNREINLAVLFEKDYDVEAAARVLRKDYDLVQYWPNGYLFKRPFRNDYTFYERQTREWQNWQNTEIEFFNQLILAKNTEGYKLYNFADKLIESPLFEDVRLKDSLVLAKYNKKWHLFDRANFKQLLTDSYDSLTVIAGCALGFRKGVACLYYSPTDSVLIPNAKSLQIGICSGGVYTLKKNKSNVFEFYMNKKLVFTRSDITDLFVAGENYLVAKKGKKRALFDLNGRTILPFIYDGILNIEGQPHTFVLLSAQKYGLYKENEKLMIKPLYERCPTMLNATHFKVVSKGKSFIINKFNTKIIETPFANVVTWNDSTVLVQELGGTASWRFLNLQSLVLSNDIFDSFSIVYNSDNELVIKTHSGKDFGLISNVRGRLMPEEYSEIRLLSTKGSKNVLYLAEKFIEQAQMYVFVMLNRLGQKCLQSNAESAFYEKFVCVQE